MALVTAPKLQQFLASTNGSAVGEISRTQNGNVRALKSAQNTTNANVEQIRTYDKATGKFRTVTLKWIPRFPASAVATTRTTACLGTVPTESSIDVAITRYAEAPQTKICISEMNQVLEGKMEILARYFRISANSIISNINQVAFAQQALNVGTYQDGSVTKAFTLMAGGNPNPGEEGNLMLEYAYIEGEGTPIIVGTGNVARYYNWYNSFSTTQLNGGANAIIGRSDFFFDQYASTALANANAGLMWRPGAIQLLEGNDYGPDARMMNDISEKRIVVDPVSGLAFDYSLTYSSCDDCYFLKISKPWDIAFIPVGTFGAGDTLPTTVRGTLKLTA